MGDGLLLWTVSALANGAHIASRQAAGPLRGKRLSGPNYVRRCRSYLYAPVIVSRLICHTCAPRNFLGPILSSAFLELLNFLRETMISRVTYQKRYEIFFSNIIKSTYIIHNSTWYEIWKPNFKFKLFLFYLKGNRNLVDRYENLYCETKLWFLEE